MINGQRFATFSKTQNLGLVSLKSIKDTEVYNTVSNKLQEVSNDLKAMSDSIVQGILPEGVTLKDVRNAIDNSIRWVKDTFTALKDISGAAIKDIESLIAGLLPDSPVLQNAFRNLSANCRNNALGKAPGFKKYKDSIGCPVTKGAKCNQSEVSGLLGKVTGGAIDLVSRSVQSILNSLIALGNLGYSGNLCKIFGALTNGMDKSIIQRGAASLLATYGGLGQTSAILDIGANLGSAIPALEIPGLVARAASNFTIPENYKQGGLSNLFDGYDTALGAIQPGFDVSQDGTYSIANMGNYNNDLGMCTREYAADNEITDFDEPVLKDNWERTTAYSADRGNTDPGWDYGSASTDDW